MYLHLGRTEPAPRAAGETPGPVTPFPIRRVLDTGSQPFRCVCRIHVRTTKSGNSFGTGVLIGRYHVLTCAHVLYPRANPNPREVTVLPGQHGLDDKRSPLTADGWAVSPGWRWNDCETDDRDLAILRLARPTDAGFCPVTPFDPTMLSGWSVRAHLAGYAALQDDPKAHWMYESAGRVIGRIRINCCCEPTPNKKGVLNRTLFKDIGDTTRLLAHTLDSRPSMSGGPMWTFWQGKRVLFALHAGDIDNGARKKAVLLNSSFRAQIAEWMSRTLPSPRVGSR
jgi:hypothetical protein